MTWSRADEFLRRKVAATVRRLGLLSPGDRVAVGVSGGKDSRALLELLVAGVDLGAARSAEPHDGGRAYEVVAVHIDGSVAGLPDLKPSLVPWLEAAGCR